MDRVTKVLCVATLDYFEKWRFAIKAQQEYASRIGAEHVLIDSTVKGLNAKWTKLAKTLAYIESDQDVLLLDADAEPVDSAPSIFDLLTEHPSKYIFYALGNSGRANSGVMLFRGGRGSPSSSFLKACLNSRTAKLDRSDFVTVEGENGHVIKHLRDSETAKYTQEVSSLWNAMRRTLFEEAYIRHYTNEMRQALKSSALTD